MSINYIGKIYYKRNNNFINLILDEDTNQLNLSLKDFFNFFKSYNIKYIFFYHYIYDYQLQQIYTIIDYSPLTIIYKNYKKPIYYINIFKFIFWLIKFSPNNYLIYCTIFSIGLSLLTISQLFYLFFSWKQIF